MKEPESIRPYWVVYQNTDSAAHRFVSVIHAYSLADATSQAEWEAAHHMGHGGIDTKQRVCVYGVYCRQSDADMYAR